MSEAKKLIGFTDDEIRFLIQLLTGEAARHDASHNRKEQVNAEIIKRRLEGAFE